MGDAAGDGDPQLRMVRGGLAAAEGDPPPFPPLPPSSHRVLAPVPVPPAAGEGRRRSG